MNSKRIDYNGDEVLHALPVWLGEVLPGLPPAGVAGSIDALCIASPEVVKGLHDFYSHLLPSDQWADSVPGACVHVENDAEYFKLISRRFSIQMV